MPDSKRFRITGELAVEFERLRQEFLDLKRHQEKLDTEEVQRLRISTIQRYGIDPLDFDLNDKSMFARNLIIMMLGLQQRHPQEVAKMAEEAKRNGAI